MYNIYALCIIIINVKSKVQITSKSASKICLREFSFDKEFYIDKTLSRNYKRNTCLTVLNKNQGLPRYL